jgi:hypothetical protein
MGWAEFWESTPYATGLYLAAWAEQQRANHEALITAAFQSAYFGRMEKLGAKQLEQALGRKPTPTKQQSDDEIGRSVFAWLKAAEAPNDRRAGH